MYTKYEVSMSNPVPGERCAQMTMMLMPMTPTSTPTTDKAWLYKALWLINQMSQKLKLDFLNIAVNGKKW